MTKRNWLKIAFLVILVALICSVLFACTGKWKNKYFNNFEQKAVSSIVSEGVKLSEGVEIGSYDVMSDVFITYKKYPIGNYYGLASKDKEYTAPCYYSVVAINGDYAIVARTKTESILTGTTYIGVIKFRGDGINVPVNMSSFNIIYVNTYTQMGFVGDYVYVRGDLNETTSNSNYTTFYDYKSGNELLEVFKMRQSYDTTTSSFYNYKIEDNYLCAYTTDKAYFYNLNIASVYNGYLENTNNEAFVAFSEMQDEISSYGRKLDIYYMGNGWFARSAMIYKTEAFSGFNIMIPNQASGNMMYCRTKTDFYNVKTGITNTIAQINYIAGVANKYTQRFYTEYAALLSTYTTNNEETGRAEYELPYNNPYAMVNDEYSILYFYYLPYAEEYAGDSEYMDFYGATTYCLIDENLKTTLLETLMPVVYIDGVGIQTADPEYTELVGDAYSYNAKLEKTTLTKYVVKEKSYTALYANKDAVVIRLATLVNNEGKYYYGAVSPDGKQIVDYVYDELSIFVDGIAIGTKLNGNTATYYKINTKGEETLIDDNISVVCQGTYVYKNADGSFGIKTYAGNVLKDNCESISVVDIPMPEKDVLSKSYLVAKVDGYNYIYLLG